MIISHDLNSNGYLINNEIWFNVNSDVAVVYFRMVLTNLGNGKISTNFISYADANNNAFVNIQPIINMLPFMTSFFLHRK